MHEILKRLRLGNRVLDLGCASGSFRAEEYPATTVRADLEVGNPRTGVPFVNCDARLLPFADRAFDAVILNHSLEHFENPATVLAEIRRVLREPAYLYIAVPDASTLTDKVYRWLGRGGGHVNQFTRAREVQRMIEEQTGLPHVGTRLLFSGLSFLNRRNRKARPPRRIYLLGGGAEWQLRLGMFALRKIDSLIGARASIYGWAFLFGTPVDFDPRPWSNVCIRCGAGHASKALLATGKVRRGWLGLRLFPCPDCGAANYFTDDRAFTRVRL